MKIELVKPNFKSESIIPMTKQISDYLVSTINTLNVLLGEIDTDNLSSNLLSKLSAQAITEGEINNLIEDSTGLYKTQIKQNAEAITLEAERAASAEGTLDSKITVVGGQITSEVTRATTAEGTLSSRITQTEEGITSEVTRATTAEGSLDSKITQTSESISSEVTRATEAEGTLSSRITQTEEAITSKVSAGDIASTINQTAQSVTIDANKINLNGAVTINGRFSINATTGEMYCDYAEIENATINNATIEGNLIGSSVKIGDSNDSAYLKIDTTSAENVILRGNYLRLQGLRTITNYFNDVILFDEGSTTYFGAEKGKGYDTRLRGDYIYIGTTGCELHMAGHLMDFYSVKTTDGTTVNVLGYES